MFSPPKPSAALTSGLLARKGHARPAMRPQGFVGLTPATASDDLGWNDMGEDAPADADPRPPVLRQRDAAAARVAAPALPADAMFRVAREVRRKMTRAAFTLRLDSDRHLRLRLASAARNRSAQQLVTEALDAFLESLPEVDALVRQLEAGDGGK